MRIGRVDSHVPVWMSHNTATPLKGILVPREAMLLGPRTNADMQAQRPCMNVTPSPITITHSVNI